MGVRLQVLPNKERGALRAAFYWGPQCCCVSSNGRGRTGRTLSSPGENCFIFPRAWTQGNKTIPGLFHGVVGAYPRAAPEQSVRCAFCPALGSPAGASSVGEGMFTGLMIEAWRQAAVPESWHSLFPPVQVFAQLCLAVAWGVSTAGQVSSHGSGAGRSPSCSPVGETEKKNQRKVVVAARSLWLPCFPASYIAVLCSLSLRGIWSWRAVAELGTF